MARGTSMMGDLHMAGADGDHDAEAANAHKAHALRGSEWARHSLIAKTRCLYAIPLHCTLWGGMLTFRNMILRVVFFPGEGAIELLVLTSDSERDAFPYPSGSSREFLAASPEAR